LTRGVAREVIAVQLGGVMSNDLVETEPTSPGARALRWAVENLASDTAEIQAAVEKLRRDNPSATPEEIASAHADRICWLYAGQGAATALPGVIPGLGTAMQVGVEAAAILTDVGFMIRNQANMSMGVAVAFGHPLNHAARLDELAVQLGLWCGAVVPAREAAKRVGIKIAVAQFQKVPGKIFQKINQRVGTTILTKYGAKRGGIAVGRLIPFGVGALVGGGVNLAAMKGFKGVALRFYRDELPADAEFEVA